MSWPGCTSSHILGEHHANPIVSVGFGKNWVLGSNGMSPSLLTARRSLPGVGTRPSSCGTRGLEKASRMPVDKGDSQSQTENCRRHFALTAKSGDRAWAFADLHAVSCRVFPPSLIRFTVYALTF